MFIPVPCHAVSVFPTLCFSIELVLEFWSLPAWPVRLSQPLLFCFLVSDHWPVFILDFVYSLVPLLWWIFGVTNFGLFLILSSAYRLVHCLSFHSNYFSTSVVWEFCVWPRPAVTGNKLWKSGSRLESSHTAYSQWRCSSQWCGW